MKCVKNTNGVIRRVRDDQAAAYVKSDDWEYIPKSEWKAARVAQTGKKAAEKKAAAVEKKADTKSVNNSKSQKRNRRRQQKNRSQQKETDNG